MKNDLLEDRKEDWLAQEYRRENLRNNLDLGDAKKLKDEHYRKHQDKNECDIDIIHFTAIIGVGFVILCLFGVLFYEFMRCLSI